MSLRPEYYSGRWAILGDLNGEILENSYNSIIESPGKKATNEFIERVSDILKLSTTDFLNSLYSLNQIIGNWIKDI